MAKLGNSGIYVADDVKSDGQVGVTEDPNGVWVCVLPARGCFRASTVLDKAEGRAIARKILEIVGEEE